jgi:hypothetical protein
MSGDSSTQGSSNGEEVDPGQPIDALSGFEYDASSSLLSRIRRTIQRRTAVSQIVSFSWGASLLVLLEFWLALADTLFPKSNGKDQRR